MGYFDLVNSLELVMAACQHIMSLFDNAEHNTACENLSMSAFLFCHNSDAFLLSSFVLNIQTRV